MIMCKQCLKLAWNVVRQHISLETQVVSKHVLGNFSSGYEIANLIMRDGSQTNEQ